MIYFVREPAADRVKIGVSADPWKRLRYMQTGSPGALHMEAVCAGGKAEEAALHERFRDRHARGEWFVWSGPIAVFVAGLDRQLVAVPIRARDRRLTQINKAVVTLGFGKAYASQMHKGNRPWPLDIAVGVWQQSGHRVGPLAEATDAELTVLAKYAPHFRPSRPAPRTRAA